MKKFGIISILFFILMSSAVFAYNTTLDGKIGTCYASDPDKLGWQLNFTYLADLDPFFGLGFEPGFYWVHWDRVVGKQNLGGAPADLKADTDAYQIPLMADAMVRFPNLEKKIYVIPYVTLGLGYSFMILDYTTPGYTVYPSGPTISSESNTKLFYGFTWQLMIGLTYDPGYSSKIKFLAEVGYRGAKLDHGNLEVDMSGFIINIGVRYPLSTSQN